LSRHINTGSPPRSAWAILRDDISPSKICKTFPSLFPLSAFADNCRPGRPVAESPELDARRPLRCSFYPAAERLVIWRKSSTEFLNPR